MDTEVRKLDKYMYVNCKIMENGKHNLNIITIYLNQFSKTEQVNLIMCQYNRYQVILFLIS